MPFFLIKSKKEFTFLKRVLLFAQKCIIFARHFSGNDLTPWGVLQVAVRRIIRLVHRRIRTGRDIDRTGCFLFSVSVRVAECHHLCTTLAATLRCGTAGRKQTNRTQTASDLWRMEVSGMKMRAARILGCDSPCYVISSLIGNSTFQSFLPYIWRGILKFAIRNSKLPTINYQLSTLQLLSTLNY